MTCKTSIFASFVGTIRIGRFILMKKVLWFLFIVVVLTALSCFAFASDLKLPAGLKRIEEQAFYGDTSLDTVTIQEGTEVISSKAFANSSV